MSTIKTKQFHFIDDMDISATTLAAVERLEEFAAQMANVVHTWVRRSNDRRQLALMNEHMLDDIGLTRGDMAREVGKHFWQK